jgi:hypothetical protein
MRQITSLLLFMLIGAGLMAQQGKLTGNVYDQSTGKALSEAIVVAGSNQTVSDANGYFEIAGLKYGETKLTVIAVGFEKYESTVKIAASQVYVKAELTSRINAENERRGVSEVNIADLEGDDESKGQAVSGLLHSSGDIFTSTASYTLGAMYFRMRGYDSENFSIYMNGINVNDAENGRASWSEWGGLNDATRNKEVVNGVSSSRFAFGGLGGSTNIITRASKQRKQIKFTYSLSDKTYTNRAMFTYSTGLMDNNWAFTVSGSRRWGEGGYVKGVFYDAWAYFVSIEKKINNQHSIGFTAFGSPTKRGQQGGATQEAYDLMGSNYYNPNWGMQDGEVRNARVKNFHEPMMILSHYWDINAKTKLTTSLGYSFGYNGGTALNWYNSADPRPDYYRYMPSYENYISNHIADPNVINLTTLAWQNDPNRSQINWDELYQMNYNANLKGKQASYVVEDRRNDQTTLNFSVLLNKELASNVNFDGGFEYRKYTGHHFKTIDDLLGGNFWLDVDNFAERDFNGDTIKNQNDVNNPNRIVKEGDVYGYDYDINSNTGQLWGQVEVIGDKIDYYIAANVNSTSFWRTGYMKNGRYLDNSFGDSETYNFFNGGGKVGFNYKINGRNFILANAQATTRAPSVYNSFLSPRTRDNVSSVLINEKILSGDINYILRTPYIKARLTLYQTMFWNQNDIISFYNDDLGTFVNYAMTGIDKVHQGMEFGTEVKATSTVSFTGVVAIGNFRYTSNSNVTITYDNGSQPDINKTVYMKNFYVNGSPQTAGSVGISYRHPKYWFFNANVNYFGDNYLDFNPERRTISALPYANPNDPRIPSIVNQIKLDDGFTVDASIGKSWQVKKVNLNLNFSISNLLDNTSLITGGYEQMRFNFDTKDINKFPPKYFYGLGRTFFLNLGIRF